MYIYILEIKTWIGFITVPDDLEELAHAERTAVEKQLKEQAAKDIESGIRSNYSLEEFIEDFGKIRLEYDNLEIFLEMAKELAKKNGWKGDGTWMMSGLPNYPHTSLVLAVKLDGSDVSYVFSRHELTWLANYEIHY